MSLAVVNAAKSRVSTVAARVLVQKPPYEKDSSFPPTRLDHSFLNVREFNRILKPVVCVANFDLDSSDLVLSGIFVRRPYGQRFGLIDEFQGYLSILNFRVNVPDVGNRVRRASSP